jgi:glycosyltransferase involved in cell wall biosynthesis
MSVKKMLSLVIPIFNEEDSIIILNEKILKALKGYNFEIIYVDDSSSDSSREVIKSIIRKKVILVELSKNYGQSLALAAGFDIAKGDYIITLDGDLQNDPNDILPMLNKAVEGDWDIVTGIRVKRKDSIIKIIPSRIANFIIRTLTRLNISDQGCALKVFKKETAKSLNLYGEMHRFINLAAYLDGARITEVPVRHNPRKFGYSKYGLGRIFKVINDILLILFQKKFLQKPIYFFGSIGVIIFSTGSILSLYFFVIRIMGQDIWGRPLLILSIMLVIIGIQIFSIGITYDLMMKTYYESQNKKPYKIRKIHQSD